MKNTTKKIPMGAAMLVYFSAMAVLMLIAGYFGGEKLCGAVFIIMAICVVPISQMDYWH